MVFYTSDQFYKEWRYSIKKDFTNPSTGETVKYAPHGFRTWGDEIYKLPFSKAPRQASVNCDGSLIAIGVGDDIYIYETATFTEFLVLKGHVSGVDGLAFQPGNPKVLVSCAQQNSGRSTPGEPTIIVWDLDKQQENPPMGDHAISSIASHATDTVVENLLMAQPQVELSAEEEESLISAIEPVISRIVRTHAVAKERTIHGLLSTSFQSETFSPSGSYLIYMPGQRPRSNGNYKWSVNIYSMATHKDVLSLGGDAGAHTDAVVWTGYSPDETMIATVSWDKSIRIWNAVTGEQKGRFYTNGQNWTGGFSPDSKRFAGTCGDATLYVYSLVDGTTLVENKWERSSWMRALDWGADSNILAIGGEGGESPARFVLYDVDKKEVLQERILSTEACVADPEVMPHLGHNLGCNLVRFLDSGRKVAVHTFGDGGVEVYDLEAWEKWRLTRPGIDPPFGDEAGDNEEKSEESAEKGLQKKKKVEEDFGYRSGFNVTIWEDKKKGTIFFASMDGDAVRIWDVPMAKEEETQ
jgi:WD40 repeat protein